MSKLHNIPSTVGYTTLEDIAKLGTGWDPARGGLDRTLSKFRAAIAASDGADTLRNDGELADAAVLALGESLGPILGLEARQMADVRTDSAPDFTTSGLTLELGAAEGVVRGQDEEFLFVPGRAARPLLPMSNRMRPGARKFRYPIFSHTGQAKFTHPSDLRNLENVGTARDQKEQGAEYFGIGYRWTIPQTWEWSMLGVNGQSELATAAAYEMDAFVEYHAGWGDADHEIPGFLALDDAIIALLGTPFSELSDAQTMLNRLGFIDDLYRRANNGARAMRAVMSDADMYALNNTRFGTGGEGDSVMTVARSLYPWLSNVTWTRRMDNASASGGGPRWILYRDDPMNLSLGNAPVQVFGPFQDRMSLEFVLLGRLTGVVGKKPEIVMNVDFDDYA